MLMDAKTLSACFLSAANALANSETPINNLNVFPVPDGDTGTNMAGTAASVCALADPEGAVGDFAALVASGYLMAARGNSGAILSLYVKGFAEGLAGLETASAAELARAMVRGTEAAYRAVPQPAEGTILTVMRVCGDRARELTEADPDLSPAALFGDLAVTAEAVLPKTMEMLPVLARAKVVDAGGVGFMTILRGFHAALCGSPVARGDRAVVEAEAADFSAFSTEDIANAFCVECIVKKSPAYAADGAAEELLERIGPFGDSVVFLDGAGLIKLHIHTNRPVFVLECAGEYGELISTKTENMRDQHSVLAGGAKDGGVAEPEKPFGFAAVCSGEGFEATLRELGADRLIPGGATMNPSTDQILAAVLATPAETVFVLPGNPNILLVAEAAARLVQPPRRAVVIPSRSLPQTIAALQAFDGSLSAEENRAAMTGALSSVRTVAVTRAVRDAELDGFRVEKDRYMALCDGTVVSCAAGRDECLRGLAETLADAVYVVLYYGENVHYQEASDAARLIAELAPDADVDFANGDQPLYDFILSVS